MEDDDRVGTLTLALFDLYWFRFFVLFRNPPPPPPPSPPPSPPPPAPEVEPLALSPPPEILLGRRFNHQRSLSDDLSLSPGFQIPAPKLHTILSGRESIPADEIPRLDRWRKRSDRRRRRRRSRSESSKSMSELEFEELKGFMDLGFTFSDAEADPRLMEIVPGLQRLRAAEDDVASDSASADDVVAPRPYLSESWDPAEEEENIPLRSLKIPIVEEGVDFKDRLRFWAHAVASAVR